MGLGTWFKSLFSKLIAAFNSFIKEAFDDTMKVLIAEFKDFAVATVVELSKTDLTSEAKRAEAFKKIKDEAAKRGKTLSDSLINILIELAVSRLKVTGA
jgi:hypothetical protein